MKTTFAICSAIIFLLALNISAQIQTNVLVQIVKAEDERRFDSVLENLMKSQNAKIRTRAALAAGRIGNDAAVTALAALLDKDSAEEVRATAAFALGEIESVKAADAILKVLSDTANPAAVRARAAEAAGKIAAANAREEKSKDLGKAIVDNLKFENERGSNASRDVVLLGLTAVLRARPEEGDVATAGFLTSADERIRTDAANTLTRLRAKNANAALRSMVKKDADEAARANAARALGAAEDKDSLSLLLNAALTDNDSRVRVSAIRAVAALKDKSAAEKLSARGENLLADYKKSKFKNPSEKNEILEIATALGRLLSNSKDERAVEFLNDFRLADKFTSPETEIALARITPEVYVKSLIDAPEKTFGADWRTSSAAFQGLGEIANLESSKETDAVKARARILLVQLISAWLTSNPQSKTTDARLAIPDLIRAFAAFKSDNTAGILRSMVDIEEDVFIRAAIAEVLADQPSSKETVEALEKAFTYSLLHDKFYNDATLAIMDALFKQDKSQASGSLIIALSATDYLVRKKAFELLGDKDLQKDKPGLPTILENSLAKKKNQLSTFSLNSKLGVLLNTNADYLRAVSRKNGSVKAVLTTEKGAFTIDFAPEDAPLTVDNFIKLARAGYFNGLAVHRVVPNFVMQDGDPRGDGNGGPGWEIRCEINMLPFERGAVGMALSGKDTGGSQWFVTHSPQPHLDGGYTVFGRVNEADMKTVDEIVRGDRILSVKIVESAARLPKTSVKITKKKRG
ncbi:MAG TPA: peptidylprolyl isomerase [Pyrinomonadaceae bacterium]|jgi:cyclophilin family peptidyl-prolyl cis-trans isomerase/HEAT repeat protein